METGELIAEESGRNHLEQTMESPSHWSKGSTLWAPEEMYRDKLSLIFVSFLSKCMAWVYTWGNAGKTQWEICTLYKLSWSRKKGKEGGTDSSGKEMKTYDSQKESVLWDWSWTRKEETLLGPLANSEWDMWIGRSCCSDIISWFGGLLAVMLESVLDLGSHTLKYLRVWGITSVTCSQIPQKKNNDKG